MSRSSRNETTLGKLTERFIDLLYKSNYSVNLNEVSSMLNIKKRRLYDITNVLEGVGLLQKTSKNVTQWNGMYPPISTANPATNCTANAADNKRSSTTNEELQHLAQKYKALEEQEQQIEKELQEYLTSEHAYVTYNDIKSCFEDQVAIAVKAPPESRLEVTEQSQIYLKSDLGPIEAYLCPSYPNAQNANKANSINETPMNNNTNSSKTFISSNKSHPSTNPAPSHITHSDQHHHLLSQHNPSTSLPPPSSYAGISSDEGRGTSTTDPQHDPTLSSVSYSEEDDNFKFLHCEIRDEYNFGLEDDYAPSSLFPDDNLGFV